MSKCVFKYIFTHTHTYIYIYIYNEICFFVSLFHSKFVINKYPDAFGSCTTRHSITEHCLLIKRSNCLIFKRLADLDRQSRGSPVYKIISIFFPACWLHHMTFYECLEWFTWDASPSKTVRSPLQSQSPVRSRVWRCRATRERPPPAGTSAQTDPDRCSSGPRSPPPEGSTRSVCPYPLQTSLVPPGSCSTACPTRWAVRQTPSPASHSQHVWVTSGTSAPARPPVSTSYTTHLLITKNI